MTSRVKLLDGFEINPIGIGTWGVGGWFSADTRRDEEQIDAIRYSLKKGQNHIDTAEMYSSGHSEEVVGQAIKGFDRTKLFIASKVYKENASSGSIPKAAEQMLERLQTDYLDLLYIHSCFDESRIEDYMKGLNKAQAEGLTKTIGVSNFRNLGQLEKAISVTKSPIVALQNHYNVTFQEEVDDDIKKLCRKEKIVIVGYSPLENSFRSKKVVQLAEKYKKSPEQIALNWLVSQEGVVTITKSMNKEHIDENLGALDFEMEKEDLELLND